VLFAGAGAQDRVSKYISLSRSDVGELKCDYERRVVYRVYVLLMCRYERGAATRAR
jgi:hypothetical protein